MQTNTDQAQLFLDASSAAAVGDTFSTAFPIVGFFSGLLVWPLLRHVRAQWIRWAAVGGVTMLHVGFSLVVSCWSQMVAAVLFGLVRTSQWASFFHLLADSEQVAPSLYSRVLGYNLLAIAAVSDLVPFVVIACIERSRSDHEPLYLVAKLSFLLVLLVTSGAFTVHLKLASSAAGGGK